MREGRSGCMGPRTKIKCIKRKARVRACPTGDRMWHCAPIRCEYPSGKQERCRIYVHTRTYICSTVKERLEFESRLSNGAVGLRRLMFHRRRLSNYLRGNICFPSLLVDCPASKVVLADDYGSPLHHFPNLVHVHRRGNPFFIPSGWFISFVLAERT